MNDIRFISSKQEHYAKARKLFGDFAALVALPQTSKNSYGRLS